MTLSPPEAKDLAELFDCACSMAFKLDDLKSLHRALLAISEHMEDDRDACAAACVLACTDNLVDELRELYSRLFDGLHKYKFSDDADNRCHPHLETKEN